MKRPMPPKAVRAFLDLMERERRSMLDEILQVRGLMPLLMKPRNSLEWTPADKCELKVHLKRLTKMSPYLVVIVAPGGFFVLPVIAWWLDRRRERNRDFNTA
jgi:hypothetical protein